MRFLSLIALSLLAVGCSATAPAPVFFNGRYYMAGDPNCIQGANVSPTRIACRNAQGQDTGYRDAMTDQQIQMYQFQVAQQRMQSQQLQQSIDANNAMMNANTQATLNRAAGWVPPQAQAVRVPGGNQIRCIRTDIYGSCRW